MATVTRYFTVHGAGFPTGLTTVGYRLIPSGSTTGTRVTAGVVEAPVGSGEYGAAVTYDSAFTGFLSWDSGTDPNFYAPEAINPNDVTATGASPAPGPLGLTFAAALGDLNRRLGTYALLADAQGCLAWAARETGQAVASVYVMTDDELDAIPADQLNYFQAVAEWRGLDTILQNFDDESIRQVGVPCADGFAEKVRPFLERRAALLYKQLEDRYGFGLSAPSAGSIPGGFASPETWPG